MQIASYIDHTLLRPTSTQLEIKKICEEALLYKFAAVCVPPPMVRPAGELLTGSSVKVVTVIGFPFGYSIIKAKLAEVEQAILDGVDELDMVINLIALKEGDWEYLENEARAILEPSHAKGKIVKIIIESGVLTAEEILLCCRLYGGLGVDFVKTSTGYAEKGASVADVRMMREELAPSVKIKASGGIRNYAFARELIEAGAERLGCSASVEIVEESCKLQATRGKQSEKNVSGTNEQENY
jgi:deoxyribose-phosphate aldolase